MKVLMARISRSWSPAQPTVTSVVIGAKWLDQPDDDLACVSITLTAEQLARIDQVSRLPV